MDWINRMCEISRQTSFRQLQDLRELQSAAGVCKMMVVQQHVSTAAVAKTTAAVALPVNPHNSNGQQQSAVKPTAAAKPLPTPFKLRDVEYHTIL